MPDDPSSELVDVIDDAGRTVATVTRREMRARRLPHRCTYLLVFNRRGEISLRARVNGAVQTGVVAAALNWAKLTPGDGNINTLTSEKLTDMGNSATFYSVLVEVELAKPIP